MHNHSYNIEKLLSTDNLDKCGIDALRSSGIEVVEQKYNKTELILELPKYDVVIIRSATTLTGDIIEAVSKTPNNRLKIIARAGTGVDNIDMDAAKRFGFLVLNTPAANTLSAAEHTCCLICSLSRHIPQACASLKNGRWDRKLYMGSELYGKTLGIVGLGRIGKEVAKRMQSFEMTTIGYDPIIKGDDVKHLNIEWMELSELWKKSDYITIHVPLLKQTENLIDSNVFSHCKPGIKIINCSRGGIVNENDLLSALNNNQCSGAALDVFVEEPPTNMELIKHPKLICTPHLGASTVEAQRRVAMEIADNLIELKKSGVIVGSVN